MKLRTWLRPGMLVKRWILVLFGGLVLTSLALAMGLAWIYRNYAFPQQTAGLVQAVTLQFIPHPFRELLVIVIGLTALGVGFFQLSRSLLSPFMTGRDDNRALAEIIASHRFGDEEPDLRIVAIGGGTGLSTLLRGLKRHNTALAAIVTVGDDGGSSGRLRQEFNMPAPGDIRNCLVALADDEAMLSNLFQYRFTAEDSALHGHSFGNLFITALTQVSGSFERAVIEASKVLKIRGTVLPSSLEDIMVVARMTDGEIVRGESNIPLARKRIERISIDPAHAEAYDPAISAILSADLVVLGPGSLYTSVVPNLLVEGIAHALRFTPAEKVYVCNVATQPGETDGYSVVDHLRALERHFAGLPIDRVLFNATVGPVKARIRPEMGISAVELPVGSELPGTVTLDGRDLISNDNPLRHDPEKLAAALLDIGYQRLGTRAQRGDASAASATARNGAWRDADAHEEAVVRSGD